MAGNTGSIAPSTPMLEVFGSKPRAKLFMSINLQDVKTVKNPYYAEQRRIHSGPRNLPCPDCGEKNKMTQGEINKGYHCAKCTRDIEGYQEPTYNEDFDCAEY